ncbi:MAG: hypothetical protein ABSC10_04955 [Candidatus Acidiferrales bacterium]|jgi:hypothetical protein
MANPVGAVSHVPQVPQASQAPPSKPAANVNKVTPQDTVNISAAGKAANQAKSAPAADEGQRGGHKD